MTKPDKNKNPASVREMYFYFSAKQQDQYDSGSLGRRCGEVLQLREKLMSLPAEQFDIAIQTLKRIVDSSPKALSKKDKELEQREKRKDAIQLFEKVNSQATQTTPDKVSRV